MPTPHAQSQIFCLSMVLGLSALSGCKVFSGSTSDGSDLGQAYTNSGGTSPADAPEVHDVNAIQLLPSNNELRANLCIPFQAIGIYANLPTVALTDIAFGLHRTQGSGFFYADASCAGGHVTGGTLTAGSASTTVYYMTDTVEKTVLLPTINDVGGRAFSGLIFGPRVYSLGDTHNGNANCVSHSISLLDSAGSPLIANATEPTSVQMFQDPGTIQGGSPVKFYDTQANCNANSAAGLLTDITGGQSTELIILGGRSSVDVFVQNNGQLGLWTFGGTSQCTEAVENVNTVNTGLVLSIDGR